MDLLPLALARDASKRGLLGVRHHDPVVPESPGLLARRRGRRPAARRESAATRSRPAPRG